jgi:hypothetical protein
MAQVNLKAFEKQMAVMKTLADDLPKQAYDYFVDKTPYRTGNAQRHTRLNKNTIVADYPYSQQLDDGYSSKSPQGMTEPTEKWIQQEVDRKLKRI